MQVKVCFRVFAMLLAVGLGVSGVVLAGDRTGIAADDGLDAFIELWVGPDADGNYFLVRTDGASSVDARETEYVVNRTAGLGLRPAVSKVAGHMRGSVVDEVEDFADCDGDSPAFGGVGTTFNARILLPNACDYDGFRFSLATDRDLTIITDSVGDTTVQLVDCDSDAPLACDDDTNDACASGFCSQIDGCLPGGRDYCIRVRPFSGMSVFDYELAIQDNGDCVATEPPAINADQNNACADPTGADFNGLLGCMSDYEYSECVIETGACCTNGPGTNSPCVVTTSTDCEAGGGLFLGPDVECISDDECENLLVTLESASARATDEGVLIEWTTALEIDTVGFRVLRQSGDAREKVLLPIGPRIIPLGSQLSGASYEVLDDSRGARKAWFYYIEDTDTFGRATLHGPFQVQRGVREAARTRVSR